MLRPVWYQLSLFPGLVPRHYAPVSKSERDERTGPQWIRAVISYLEFSSGDAWRRLSDPLRRFSPERQWYLGGLRTMNGIQSPIPQPRPHLVTPKIEPGPEAIAIAKLCLEPRLALADELLLLRPELTDRRLLSHLPRPKLARMVLSARQAGRLERAS